MDSLEALQGKRLLITGGTGFLGQRFIAFAKKHLEIELHNLSRHPVLDSVVTNHQADLMDSIALQEILASVQPEFVFHLAAGGVAYGTGTPVDLLKVNVLGLVNLLEGVKKMQAKPHVLIAGSGFEYAIQDKKLCEDDPIQPFNHYGLSKASAFLAAQLYSQEIPISLLRLFSLYGIGEKAPRIIPYVIEAALKGIPADLTLCEQLRDYSFADDIAEGFFRIAICPKPKQLRFLNLASGQAITIRQMVECLVGILQARGIEAKINFGVRPYRPEEPMTYLADVTKLEKLLHWQPPTKLEDGLSQQVEAYLAWFRKHRNYSASEAS